MGFLLPVVIGGGLLLAMNKKGASDQGDGFTTVTGPGVIPPKAGEPKLTVDKVRSVLNRVDFSFTDGKESRQFQHKWKDGAPVQQLVGKYMVRAVTEIVPDPKKEGYTTWGPVMLTVQEPGKGVKFAKHVLVNEGKVIDIK